MKTAQGLRGQGQGVGCKEGVYFYEKSVGMSFLGFKSFGIRHGSLCLKN
jgi:hypothetical protein